MWDVDKEALANAIKTLRKRKEMSQEDLAERAGVARRVVQLLEGAEANPTLETMVAIAQALDTTLDALTGRPGFAKTRVAEQSAAQARFERNWVDAAELLGAVARSKPVRRLAGLYILTRDKRYLDALHAMLPPQSQLFLWLDQAP